MAAIESSGASCTQCQHLAATRNKGKSGIADDAIADSGVDISGIAEPDCGIAVGGIAVGADTKAASTCKIHVTWKVNAM